MSFLSELYNIAIENDTTASEEIDERFMRSLVFGYNFKNMPQ